MPRGGVADQPAGGVHLAGDRREHAVRGGDPAPDPAQVAVLRRAVRSLADELHATTPPDDAEILADGVLAPVAREVDAARRLVRDAAPGRRPGPGAPDDE